MSRPNRPDRLLLRQLPAARRYLATLALVGAAAALLVITQASLLAGLLADGFHGASLGVGPAALTLPLVALVAVVAARTALAWYQETAARRAAATVLAELRARLLARTQELGPGWLSGQRAGELATLAGRGLDALGPYFTGYLPRLVLAAVVPAAVLVRLAVADPSSAAIIALTLPLIPVFAVLVGWHTKARTERQWALLSRLGAHFLDVIAGLPTLRVYGRARAQVDVVRRMAEAHRSATLRVLRVAFLSALVLELVATLSVALVAVPVGLRLLAGDLDLYTALLVLLLAPEAYLPLRAAGAAFHASVEGVAAAERALATLDERAAGDRRPRIYVPFPLRVAPEIRLDGVTVTYPGRDRPALDDVSLVVRPGERVALVGPSGAGKSTLLALLLGFVAPDRGRVLVGGLDLARLDPECVRRLIAWVPQRPHLFAGTVADNIALGAPGASAVDVRRAAGAAAADSFAAELPRGYDTEIGEGGARLSAGQRQRIALARAFLKDAPLLLLDEPTAGLDGQSEAAVLAAARRLTAGRTVLSVAHRPALLAAADRAVTLAGGRVSAEGTLRPSGSRVA
ncbi:MAG: thiol reductant ABC exporter subunit CydD [Streptosporangiales bacterium]|nr:thiol reductant ABC exporter subunit CydD [Streptosporangiales bacterium]